MDRSMMYAMLAQKVELFHGLSVDDIARIFARGMTMRYAEGETVLVKGAEGNTLYVVLNGSVGVMDGPNLLATLPVGELFGEMALLTNEPRTATVVAGEDCHLFVMNEDSIEQLLTKRIAVRILLNIVRILSHRLRDANIRTCDGG